MIKISKKHKMLKDLSNIAKYLEQAGFIDQAKEIKNVMAALDGQNLIDPHTIPNTQRSTENQEYMGGDGVGGGYSLLHAPMVGQAADDEEYEDEWWDLMGTVRFDIRKGREMARNHPIFQMSLSTPPEFARLSNVNKEFAMTTDLSKPLLVGTLSSPENGPISVLLDGHHRFYKAEQAGMSHAPAKKLNFKETMQIMSDGIAKEKMIAAMKDRGQMADDEDTHNRKIAAAVKLIKRDYQDGKFDNMPAGKLLSLLAKRLNMNIRNSQEGGFIAGLAVAMGLIHIQEAFGNPEAFQSALLMFDDPDSVEMDNADMIAGSNGLMGNSVTDNGAAGQMGLLTDTGFYTSYNNLEGRYGP